MTNFTHYRDHIGTKSEKFYKATLFRGDHVLVGINCLEPGQVQPVHEHSDQDKTYVVMEGHGRFTVGDEVRDAGPGDVVWAAPGVPHGVANDGAERLVVLVHIAPSPH